VTGVNSEGKGIMANPDIRVAAFDCYGTLVDWEGGIGSFLYSLALKHEHQPGDNGRAMRERWEAIQFEIIQGEYQTYKTVLAESLRRWLAERGYPWDDADGKALVGAMRSWQPFPDTIPALQRARQAGLMLAILSNTDRDIIAHTLRHLEIPFDEVVTAEDCGAYKPSLGNFERLLKVLGEPPERVLHVAFGFKYDIGPARRLGMQTAWVNRHVEPPPGDDRPDHTWRDLWGLPTLVGGRGPDW
jgi:2-haloalkanoic acid dehalogenase type II